MSAVWVPSCSTIRRPIRRRSPSRSGTSRGPTDGSAARPRCAAACGARSTACPPARSLTLLDLGTGARRSAARGDALGGAARPPARARRPRAEPGGGSSGAARRAAVRRSAARASPPFRDKSVDVVLVSQVVHHLARRFGGPALPGLRPPRPPRAWSSPTSGAAGSGPLAFWVGARALRFDPVTVADGMTSHPPRLHRGGAPRPARGGRRPRHGRAASGLSAGRHLAPRGGLMRTVDAIRMRAPVERVLEAAVEVERWPELLPHYRWVRMLERRGDGGLVEMAAWRPFGPVRYPTWWVSEMWVDRGGAGGALPPRARHHDRHGRGVAASSRRRGDRRDDRARVDRAAVAADRQRRRRMGDRPGVHPWDRVADAGGHPAGGGDGTT